jgi:hypothetical protein
VTGNDLKSATLILRVLTREGDDAVLAAISEELELADKYRDAQCATQSTAVVVVNGTTHRIADATSCVGENHHATCPVELAKQESWSVQDKRRSL